MTHDYIRNSATTLFTALNVLDGTIPSAPGVSALSEPSRERDIPAVDGELSPQPWPHRGLLRRRSSSQFTLAGTYLVP
jgi:hypothetical protein